jgi:hypothetical protein
MLSVSLSRARTWTVSTDGSGDFVKVSEACAAASAGDTIAIAPGAYHEDEYDDWDDPNILMVEKPLTILGTGEASTVSLKLRLGFVRCEGTTLAHLRFHHVPDPVTIWGGEYVVRGCRFEDSESSPNSYEGAIAAFGSQAVAPSLTVEDCYFARNKMLTEDGAGGAVWAPSGILVVRRSVFTENQAALRGGAIYSYDWPIIEDCIFVKNAAANGAAISVGYNSTVTRCTFYRNRCEGAVSGAIEVTDQSGICPDHCIIAGTENGYGIVCPSAATSRCSDHWENEFGASPGLWCDLLPERGNFEADPLFCDPDAGDFGLLENSPCRAGEHNGFDCGVIGAGALGCGEIGVREVTWGRVKAIFR